MDYLIRCTSCGHTVTQHGPRGCDGDASICSCPVDRDGVLAAIVTGDLVRFGGASADQRAQRVAE